LSLGVLDTRLFTAMVIMAVLTTMMTGPLLTLARRRAAAATATPEAEEAVRTG
jgi:hypothetical protein